MLLTAPEERPIGAERCQTWCHKNENTLMYKYLYVDCIWLIDDIWLVLYY
jgi:hypothetical protein